MYKMTKDDLTKKLSPFFNMADIEKFATYAEMTYKDYGSYYEEIYGDRGAYGSLCLEIYDKVEPIGKFNNFIRPILNHIVHDKVKYEKLIEQMDLEW